MLGGFGKSGGVKTQPPLDKVLPAQAEHTKVTPLPAQDTHPAPATTEHEGHSVPLRTRVLSQVKQSALVPLVQVEQEGSQEGAKWLVPSS